jgi:hypothetical protein
MGPTDADTVSFACGDPLQPAKAAQSATIAPGSSRTDSAQGCDFRLGGLRNRCHESGRACVDPDKTVATLEGQDLLLTLAKVV